MGIRCGPFESCLIRATTLQSESTSSSWSSSELGKCLLFWQLFGKPGDQLKEVVLDKSLESAIAVSKGGRTVLAVELEAWD